MPDPGRAPRWRHSAGHIHAAGACVLAASMLVLLAAPASAAPPRAVAAKKKPALPRPAAAVSAIQRASDAETRLIEVYRLFGGGRAREALAKAEALVRAYPNFQLAQLLYGDLLAARVPPSLERSGASPRPPELPALAELREEAQRRLQALRERPPAGTLPSQFLALSARSRYAIAVDASRSRLYLLQNTAQGLQLAADYYISTAKSGLDKLAEGDARTPLGIYHVTSNLDPRSLRDFYGAGALPINYPNAYDARRGRTGGGIWLHGTPPQQFARAPQSTDGCVVMANPDLRQLLRIVEPGATPVVIAPRLDWIPAAKAHAQAQSFAGALAAWRDARSHGDLARLQDFYLPDHQRAGKLAQRLPGLRDEIDQLRGRRVQLKDLTYLHWQAADDTMVVTFGEIIEGEKTGRSRRQYWLRSKNQWKVFHEEFTG